VLAALPAEARTNDLDGAVATAEFFVELYGTMLQTGDTRLWDALSGPECEYCRNASTDIAEHYEQGDSAAGGSVQVNRAATRGEVQASGDTVVAVSAVQDPFATGPGDQTTATPSGGGPFLANALLVWTGEHWVVDGVQIDSATEQS